MEVALVISLFLNISGILFGAYYHWWASDEMKDRFRRQEKAADRRTERVLDAVQNIPRQLLEAVADMGQQLGYREVKQLVDNVERKSPAPEYWRWRGLSRATPARSFGNMSVLEAEAPAAGSLEPPATSE